MKNFMDEDFLLQTPTARLLYHQYAAPMPIIDYHCHLNPEYIASNHSFANLSELWLDGDHYKWRAMRTNGVDEYYCTGELRRGRSLRSGLRPCAMLCATRYTIGRT